MKKITEVYIPRANDPTFLVRFTNTNGRKFEWNSRTRILKSKSKSKSNNGINRPRTRFHNVFTKSERKYIKSKFNIPQVYARALQNILNQENNTRRNYGVYKKGSEVEIYYKPNSTRGTFVQSIINNPHSFNISLGKTNVKFRNKGIGKQMRALMTLAAKRAGFNKITQTAVFLEQNQMKTHNKPPSSYVMKSLGFDQLDHGGFLHHKYVFKNKPNNSRLVKSAYPLRTHPLRNSTKHPTSRSIF